MMARMPKGFYQFLLIAVVAAAASLAGSAQQPPPQGGRQGGPPPGGRGGPPFPRVAPLPAPEEPRMFDTLDPGTAIRVVPFVKGLASPWSLAFLPNGDMLVTEKVGRL